VEHNPPKIEEPPKTNATPLAPKHDTSGHSEQKEKEEKENAIENEETKQEPPTLLDKAIRADETSTKGIDAVATGIGIIAVGLDTISSFLSENAQQILEFATKIYEISESYESAREQTEMVVARLSIIGNCIEEKAKQSMNPNFKLSKQEEQAYEKLADYLKDRSKQLEHFLDMFQETQDEKNKVVKFFKGVKNRFIDGKPFAELINQIDHDLDRICACLQTADGDAFVKASNAIAEEANYMNKTLEEMRGLFQTAFSNETISSISELDLKVWWYKNFKAEPIVSWRSFSLGLETYISNNLDQPLRKSKEYASLMRPFFDLDNDGSVDVNELKIILGDDENSTKQKLKFRTYVQEKIILLQADAK